MGVALLHAYANGAHERRIRDRFQERAPNIAVSISTEVSPKFREYERTSTTVTNAYVMSMVDRYLGHLEDALEQLGCHGKLQIMQSNGGLVSPEIARSPKPCEVSKAAVLTRPSSNSATSNRCG